MSEPSTRTGQHNGVYISNREIYGEVQILKSEMMKFKVYFSLIGLVAGPIVSTIAATYVSNMKG